MYKFIIAFICCYSSVYACDFCGCSPSVMSSDLSNLQPQSSVSTTTSYKKYQYLTSDVGLQQTHVVAQQLSISYAPNNWVELRTTLPFVWMQNNYAVAQEKKFGIGDMNVFSSFKAWSKSPLKHKRKLGQQLNLGVGIELPTGKNKQSYEQLSQQFMFGSKSIDLLFSGIYSLSIRKFGFITAAFVKVNTPNKAEIRYGNNFVFQIIGNYSASTKHCMLMPNIGVKADYTQKNIYRHIIQSKSGGYALYATYGLDMMIKNWNLSGRFEHAFVQHVANNSLKEKASVMIKVGYVFKQKNKIKKDVSNDNSLQTFKNKKTK